MSRPKANPVGNPRYAVDKSAPSKDIERVSDRPELPASIHTDDGRALWDELWDIGVGVYNKAHIRTVERYVNMQERRSHFLAVLDTEGWTSVGSQGQPIVHPIGNQLSKLESELRALEDRLGLSPEASLRLGIATVEAKSKLEQFLEHSKSAT